MRSLRLTTHRGSASAIRRIFVALLACAALLGGAQTAVAQVPPTLGGTGLITQTEGFPGTNADVDCVAPGERFNFTSSGITVGTYPGTYEASGTVVFASRAGAGFPGPGPIISFTETFTVRSGDTTITGTKVLGPPSVPGGGETLNEASCGTITQGSHLFTQSYAALGATYEARIESPSGTYTDRGGSVLVLEDTERRDAETGEVIIDSETFNEGFVSDLTAPEPVRPESAEDCKKGGWQTYGIFKNQGDCVSFVATNGKNEPGQNQPGH